MRTAQLGPPPIGQLYFPNARGSGRPETLQHRAIELAKKLAATLDQVVAAHKTYGLSVFIRELSQPNTGLGRATLVLQPLAPPNEIG